MKGIKFKVGDIVLWKYNRHCTGIITQSIIHFTTQDSYNKVKVFWFDTLTITCTLTPLDYIMKENEE